jgi:hypothetical protein
MEDRSEWKWLPWGETRARLNSQRTVVEYIHSTSNEKEDDNNDCNSVNNLLKIPDFQDYLINSSQNISTNGFRICISVKVLFTLCNYLFIYLFNK